MSKHKAAVVIPVYKPEFSAYDLVSLQQCFKVLKEYPVIFVKPQSLVMPGGIAIGYEVISFNDEYFKSIEGYNKLMLTEAFYKSFSDYQFILIHQLDAFVFSDQLDYWCAQGFDYIGAPWVGVKEYKSLFAKVKSAIRQYFYTRYNLKEKDGSPKIKQLENKVGNGGLSLRRVELFAAYCNRFKSSIDKYIQEQDSWFNEDIFWSIELNRKKKYLNTPDFKTGLRFALETHLEIAFEKNNRQLPFGCHAWDKHTDFWRPIFKTYGYDI